MATRPHEGVTEIGPTFGGRSIATWWGPFIKDVGFPVFMAIVLLYAVVVRFPELLETTTDKLTASLERANTAQNETLRSIEQENARRWERILEELRRPR